MTDFWNPSSWRDRPAQQQPEWPDQAALERSLKTISGFPPLVFAGEARSLEQDLADVASGRAFLLQAGDCAESFDALSANSIRDKLKVILQMAVILTYSSGVPVVKVGRIAGQFAKPRSKPTETLDDVELPSFRGDMVNEVTFEQSARLADPERLVTAYNQSSATLNLLRSFTKGGFADLHSIHAWNMQFVAASPAGRQFERLADEIDRALRFMQACGIEPGTHHQLHQVDFYTSHEALVLPYEEALTRQDSLTGDWYDCSAHMLWVGERTRQTDGAHVEFLRGIKNPVGCKIGPTATPEEVIALCESLNPDRRPGRLTLITRMGADRVNDLLPPLLQAVADAGHPVVWACDAMHGNTQTVSGVKTRHFDDILTEIAGFFRAHREVGTTPGGVHCELTGDDVTECLGGADEILDTDLAQRYETKCDPRLNASQSIDLAFRVADLLRSS